MQWHSESITYSCIDKTKFELAIEPSFVNMQHGIGILFLHVHHVVSGNLRCTLGLSIGVKGNKIDINNNKDGR